MKTPLIRYLSLFALLLCACGTAVRGDATQPPADLPPTASPLPPTATSAPTFTPTPVPTATATPTPLPPTLTPTPAPQVLIGAGDIAYCGEAIGDEQTAEILKRYPGAAIFTAGDNAYEDGRAIEFQNCYDPTWGQFKNRTRPVPGNHDYHTDQGAPYYAYFGEAAGPAGLGYYSYDLGDWHIVALNSNCNDIACGRDSAQAAWLRADLQNTTKRCTLVYWHHPRFSSKIGSGYGSVSTFFKIAREFTVEVVVNGDNHSYERFAPQDGDANPDPQGVRQFVVGTGGAGLYEWGEIAPNSEVRDNQTWGVIKFELYPTGYRWEFLPVEGSTFTDSGAGECH